MFFSGLCRYISDQIVSKEYAATACNNFGVESAVGGEGERAGEAEGMHGGAVGAGVGAPPRG